MPRYEFSCPKCNKEFTLILSLSEYEKKDFKCPDCGSAEVKQLVSPFYAKTSSKS